MAENRGGELNLGVEKESGPVKRVAERVGKFLAETYTVKGAISKELRKLDKVNGSFTLEQQQEMRAYFAAKAEKSAKWKVIRNWVATGAGLALGGWVAAVGPEKAVGAVLCAAGKAGEWWTGTALPTLGKLGTGIGGAFEAVRGSLSDKMYAFREWFFDVPAGKNVVNIDISGPSKALAATGDALGSAGDWLTGRAQGVTKGLQLLWKSIGEGPGVPLFPTFNWITK